MAAPQIHPSSEVDPGALIGEDTKIWLHCQVRADASIGKACNLGKGVYVEEGVRIGDRCKIQNYVSLYKGVELEEGVFVGPHCTFTNDKHPRAIRSDGAPKGPEDWTLTPTRVLSGASLGAHSVILCGVRIGRFAMVGAGSVVTRDIPDHGLAMGNPAVLRGWVCRCGMTVSREARASGSAKCSACGATVPLGGEAQ